MPTINDQYNVINNIILTEQTVVPPTPPSGKQRLYVSASGLQLIGSSGSPLLVGSLNDYILIQDQKASGTNGGTFTSGAFQTRDLNTEVSDSGGHASLASNQITLSAGTYVFHVVSPAFYVQANRAAFYNVTDATYVAYGTNEYAGRGTPDIVTVKSLVFGEFTITSPKVFEVRHRCLTTYATSGYGLAMNWGMNELYTTAEFWKTA